MGIKRMLARMLATRVARREGILRQLGKQPETLANILSHGGYAPIPGEPPKTPWPAAWVDRSDARAAETKGHLLQWLDAKAPLQPSDFRRRLSEQQVLELLTEKALFRHIQDNLELVVRALTENPEQLARLAQSETLQVAMCQQWAFRNSIRAFRQDEIMSGLSFRAPAAVVSYPRSGSNFLQSILTHSSGLNNQSIYGRKVKFTARDFTLSVKSHAPTPEYLAGEFPRKVERPEQPERIILLLRDPRDVMISFYEYTQAQRGVQIPQGTFLTGVCYFYASFIDPESERRVERGPLSVLDAYKKHIETWVAQRPAGLSCLEVRYETLQTDPERGFGEVFRYLNLDCPLAKAYLPVKVSQYDETRKDRGTAEAWRKHGEQYRELLDGVEAHLRDEIALLGYRPA